MSEELAGSAKSAHERAVSATRAQIETAMQLNAKYFDGEGLTYIPAILQALSQNYGAQLLRSKPA